jgi:zinc/manganese transport system permease protein
VNFALVFDPLFRIPFANGLLLAVTLPLVGAYVRLRDEWLASLGLAQATAAGGVVGALMGVHPLAGAIGAAAATAGLKGKLVKAGNDVYAVTILAGWCVALVGAANSVKGEELSHALLEGQLYFTTAHHLAAAACLLLAAAVGLPWMSRRLLLERFFPEHLGANGTQTWRLHAGFDLLVAFSVALSTQSIGVMATFGLVFLPPWAVFHGAPGWRKALVGTAVVGIAGYLVSFVVAILLNQPFGPVFVAVLAASGIVVRPLGRLLGR